MRNAMLMNDEMLDNVAGGYVGHYRTQNPEAVRKTIDAISNGVKKAYNFLEELRKKITPNHSVPEQPNYNDPRRIIC